MDTNNPSAAVVAAANRYAMASANHKKAVIRVAVAKAELEAATKAEAQASEENERVRKGFAELIVSLG